MPRKPKSQIQSILDYKATFGTEQGKRVLDDLMGFCHMLHTSYIPERPIETAYREGERNVLLRILSMMETDMERLKQMIKERESQG